MKSKILIFGIALLILVFGVSAVINEKNTFKENIINSSGEFFTGRLLNNVSVIGFECSAVNCSSGLGSQFISNNSGTNNFMNLQYPNAFPAGVLGYGLYFFKEGFIPYEAFVDYTFSGAGDTTAGDADANLSKKDSCVVNITDVAIYQRAGNALVNFTIHSPIDNFGPLNPTPIVLRDYYSTNESVVVNATNGTIVSSATYNFNLPFSGKSTLNDVTFGMTGDVNVTIESFVTGGACASSLNFSARGSVKVPSITDTTPPSLPIGLHVIDRGTSYITWAWTNPSDLDFANNHVLINGTHIATISGTSYNATGLLANTSYVIALHPVDLSGNMNMIGLADINSTLPLSGGGNNIGNVSVVINSPLNGTLYNDTNTVLINITVENATNIKYSLTDGGVWINYTNPVNLTGLPNGNYTLIAFAYNTLNNATNSSSFSVNFSGSTDMTPPGPITNLTLIDRGNSYLTWNWTNPSDIDFNYNIIYVDGTKVNATSSNNYNITGLGAGTTHIIKVCTVDLFANVNMSQCVSGTGTTLSNDDDDDDNDGDDNHGGGGGNQDDEYYANYPISSYNNLGNYSLGNESINIKGTIEDKKEINLLSIFLFILLILSCILLLILVYVLMRRK